MDHRVIPGNLLTLAEKLLNCVPEWLKAKRDQADRFAEYCDNIADLLDDTVASLREGRTPHGNCAQLDRHMREASDVLRNCVSNDDRAQIDHDLSVAHRVEYLDRAFSDPADREKGYNTTEIAAGRFRAIASTLRATGTIAPR